MSPYFKHFLKNAAVGATTGAVVGATCGSGAGVAGLNSLCSGPMDTPGCNYLVSSSKGSASSSGAAAGAAIGFTVGGIVYPLYKGLLGWCYPRTKESVNIDDINVQVDVTVAPSPKEKATV
jgi:hypothetical protein